ncbi:zinc-finger of mitochondrial splicing suppressor 51-domain-containing protein [Leptodontidium sp. 2 PMI_412]|nr:zinc-finger of mitochondrial splicing suppressor 51-domain-containing protein [Leptodontidium sp. 2 PMI_412]
MRNSASYTCNRCLNALKTTSRILHRPAISSRLAWGSRTISTSQQNGTKLPGREDATQRPIGRRAASSLGGHGQKVKNEPFEFRTPGGPEPTASPATQSRPLLMPNNLFHPFSSSPSPEIRRRAAFMKQNAYCPHPDHHQTRLPMNPDDPEARKSAKGPLPPAHVDFECPDCGIPVSCSEEHWADDYEAHLEICDTLREINEDDHDLRSGRFFPEFEYPGDQIEEAMVNMTNWDTFLFSREFQAINDERSLRQATRLLTYPVTVGSILHELSPYSIKREGRLTVEGLKSLSALRYSLHPPRSGGGPDVKGLRPTPPPMRIFILGARAESSLPREVWVQLTHLFPRVAFHLVFIGPESMANRDAEFPLPERTPSNPYGAIVEDRITNSLKISTYVEYYHTLHEAGHFYPYDPYFDCFMLFHPGLGHPASSHEWEETIPQLLETKVPILVTGYTQYDMERDIDWVKQKVGGEMDMLMEPGENRFRSLRWDLNDLDPQDISCGNWGVWAFRGKRYETTRKGSETEP